MHAHARKHKCIVLVEDHEQQRLVRVYVSPRAAEGQGRAERTAFDSGVFLRANNTTPREQHTVSSTNARKNGTKSSRGCKRMKSKAKQKQRAVAEKAWLAELRVTGKM